MSSLPITDVTLGAQHAVTLSDPMVVLYAIALGFTVAGVLLTLTELVSDSRLTLLPNRPLESWLGLGGLAVRIISGPVILLNYIGPVTRHAPSRSLVLIMALAFSIFWAFCSGVIAIHGLTALFAR